MGSLLGAEFNHLSAGPSVCWHVFGGVAFVDIKQWLHLQAFLSPWETLAILPLQTKLLFWIEFHTHVSFPPSFVCQRVSCCQSRDFAKSLMLSATYFNQMAI